MEATYNQAFVELSVVEAALADDEDSMAELLRSMFPGERRALRNALTSVVRRIDELP